MSDGEQFRISITEVQPKMQEKNESMRHSYDTDTVGTAGCRARRFYAFCRFGRLVLVNSPTAWFQVTIQGTSREYSSRAPI